MLKVLFFGDVSGAIARNALTKILPKLKNKFKPDLIIANADNLAHGKGVTEKSLLEMKNIGINFFTCGNHAFKKEDPNKIISNTKINFIIPENMGDTKSGNGYKIIKIKKQKIAIINLLGKTFVKEGSDAKCPFKTFDELYKKLKNQHDFLIVDFHAETTSEKIAFGFYADGRVHAVLGTHTHVQTNDAHILEKGTAYITDIGWIGAKDSVIGVKKEIIIDKFLNDSKMVFDFPDTGIVTINAVLLDLDKSMKKNKIKLINEETLIK
ncbi:MAG: TIGR00282 family metallophosphoesterase [Patescibacteria group bacterium]|nr:TIGR00282 family metallophosphoesterase [Patescibacteria group bacterium]